MNIAYIGAMIAAILGTIISQWVCIATIGVLIGRLIIKYAEHRSMVLTICLIFLMVYIFTELVGGFYKLYWWSYMLDLSLMYLGILFTVRKKFRKKTIPLSNEEAVV